MVGRGSHDLLGPAPLVQVWKTAYAFSSLPLEALTMLVTV
jgi:hypothetical protein